MKSETGGVRAATVARVPLFSLPCCAGAIRAYVTQNWTKAYVVVARVGNNPMTVPIAKCLKEKYIQMPRNKLVAWLNDSHQLKIQDLEATSLP